MSNDLPQQLSLFNFNYKPKLRDRNGRFIEGVHYSPTTELKKGDHWRNKKPFWNKKWLREEYIDNFRSASDIAEQFNVTESAILYWLHKHKIKRRNMSDIRKGKHWGATGKANGMYGKTGEDNPNWRGGISAERQAFYSSKEWKNIAQKVWERDKAICQRCGVHKEDYDGDFHIHHIVSFQIKELRAKLSNLILVCKTCHNWIHSDKNIDKEFIKNV